MPAIKRFAGMARSYKLQLRHLGLFNLTSRSDTGRAARDDAHAVIGTAMAGRLSATALSPVGIAAAIISTAVVMRHPFSLMPDDVRGA